MPKAGDTCIYIMCPERDKPAIYDEQGSFIQCQIEDYD